MEHNKMQRREERRPMMRQECDSSVAATAWKIVGGTAVALIAAAVIISLPDIKRYIKISTM